MAKQVWVEKKRNRLVTQQMDVTGPERDKNAPVSMPVPADDSTDHNLNAGGVLIPLSDTAPEVCRSRNEAIPRQQCD
jgi:hypothetical protein